MNKHKWNWQRTYHPSNSDSVTSKASKGLVGLLVSQDLAAGSKPDSWRAQAHFLRWPSLSERRIPGRKAAEDIAEVFAGDRLVYEEYAYPEKKANDKGVAKLVKRLAKGL